MPLALRDLQAAFAAHVAGRRSRRPRGCRRGRLDLGRGAAARPSPSRRAQPRQRRSPPPSRPSQALVGEEFFRGMAQALHRRRRCRRSRCWPSMAPTFRPSSRATSRRPALALPGGRRPARLGAERGVPRPAGRRLAAADLAGDRGGAACRRCRSALPAGAALIGSRYPLDRIWHASQPGATAEAVDLGGGRARSPGAAPGRRCGLHRPGRGRGGLRCGPGRRDSPWRWRPSRRSQAEPAFDLSTAFARLLALEAFAALQQELRDGRLKCARIMRLY